MPDCHNKTNREFGNIKIKKFFDIARLYIILTRLRTAAKKVIFTEGRNRARKERGETASAEETVWRDGRSWEEHWQAA
jgi:hypothetical protein